MADNVNIEAKLCSYVEGDLDPAGRAEIERYLEANPQYRPILEELVRTRGELRALPRVKAPVDLQENLSGQLERSALLGDQNLLREVGKRPRFPHARAWAAVLLLTAALAAVVYSVLPARKAQMSELANLTTSPVDIAPIAASAPTSNLADAEAAANQTVAAMAAPGPAPAVTPQLSVALHETAPVPTSIDQTPATMPALNSAAVAQSVIVPTPDLPAAEAQVHAYLNSQNYSFGSTSAKDIGTETGTPLALGDSMDKTLHEGPLGKPEVRMIVVHQLTDSQVRQTRMAMASIHPINSNAASGFVEGSYTYHVTPTNIGKFAKAETTFDAGALAANVNATSFPTTDIDLAPGESIRVTAQDTGLGDVTAMDEVMTIDADGNITLPLVGKIRAAGMPPAALSRSIALSYEIAKSPTRANWTIHPLPTTNLASVLSQPRAAEVGNFQIIPSVAPLPVTRPSTGESIDQAGQGGASLTGPEAVAPAAKTLESATTLAVAATSPGEPRSDLTIVLVGTTPPSTLPTTTPDVTNPPSTAPLAP